MRPLLIPTIVLVAVTIPTFVSLLPAVLAEHPMARATLLACAPVFFGLIYVLVVGAMSIPFRRAIVSGRFPRQLSDPVYGRRRLYGLCWTLVYYFTPLYHAWLSVPLLKVALFKLFGYRGPTDFTIYPDTWIRDLPLLHLGNGVYLSNKATIGTNMCLNDGTILVDAVTLEAGAMVGHLAMVGPGAVVGERAEIGVACAIGIGARVGKRARIGPACVVDHGAVIGAASIIGTRSYIGVRARIADGIRIPPGTVIPARALITQQVDVRGYVHAATAPASAVAASPSILATSGEP